LLFLFFVTGGDEKGELSFFAFFSLHNWKKKNYDIDSAVRNKLPRRKQGRGNMNGYFIAVSRVNRKPLMWN
jgi:hypothetical protein